MEERTKRGGKEIVKLTALKTFLPELDVPEATQQHLALMTSLDGSLLVMARSKKIAGPDRTGPLQHRTEPDRGWTGF